MQKTKPRILGLDLGANSLGWALLEPDADTCRVVAAGVRVFEAGHDNFDTHKEASRNKDRRDQRQIRRQLKRRAQRKTTLFHLLQGGGLLPEGPASTAEERTKILMDLDRALLAQWADGDHRRAQVVPYRLRAAALDQPLPPHSLGRALYHLGQRRGFKSNRKSAPSADEKPGQVKEDVAALQKKLQDTGCRTLGEFFASCDPFERRIRQRWTGREMFVKEFDAIWSAQLPHHPAILTTALGNDVRHAMFFQRPLKSQRHLIGRCEFEPTRRRASRACLAFQRFRIVQTVNNLVFISEDTGEERRLDPDERQKLVQHLDTKAKITFKGIARLLRLGKVRFNLEDGGEKQIKGNSTTYKLRGLLGAHWDDLAATDRDRLVDEILAYESETGLRRRLRREWGFDDDTATNVAAVTLEPDYANLSRAAISTLLPHLENGLHYAEAVDKAYPDYRSAQTAVETLPPVTKMVGEVRNPTVLRSLSELRKVVNAIIRAHGKPTTIRLEMARDLKRPRQARMDIQKRARQNQKAREAAATSIIKEVGIDAPSRADIEKYLLAEECNWTCPYTGKRITMNTLFNTPQFDVEHIIPRERSLNNTFLNKTLCWHEENRHRKGSKTPLEAYGPVESSEFGAILGRVRQFQGSKGQTLAKFRFFTMTSEQVQEAFDGFCDRHLQDTAYASRLAADYLAGLYGGRIDAAGTQRIQTTSGQANAIFRNVWGLNAILGDGPGKSRDDHRHHAVDAIVTALATPNRIKGLSTRASRQHGRQGFHDVPLPHTNLLDEARRAIHGIVVSHRLTRRLNGALHEDTNYSNRQHHPTGKDGAVEEWRHLRKPIEGLSAGDIERIVDRRVRDCVQSKLEESGHSDPGKAFKDPARHPRLPTAAGDGVPIHKVRIRLQRNTKRIAGGVAARNVWLRSNHHLEILEVASADAGQQPTWIGRVVSRLEAMRRKQRGTPIVGGPTCPEETLLFTLRPSECVKMVHKGEEGVFVVKGISQERHRSPGLSLLALNEARPASAVRKKGEKAQVRKTPDTLRTAHASKVAISPLGAVLPSRD